MRTVLPAVVKLRFACLATGRVLRLLCSSIVGLGCLLCSIVAIDAYLALAATLRLRFLRVLRTWCRACG